MLQRCADRDNGSRKSQVSQAEYSMVLQKSARSNFGFLNASTSSLTYPDGALTKGAPICAETPALPSGDDGCCLRLCNGAVACSDD
jgi:hypothetical protein